MAKRLTLVKCYGDNFVVAPSNHWLTIAANKNKTGVNAVLLAERALTPKPT
jgi:hypothetical protein